MILEANRGYQPTVFSLWSIVAHLRSSQSSQVSLQPWSTISSSLFGDFFSIFQRSEVGLLICLVIIKLFEIVFITAAQKPGVGMDLDETRTAGKGIWYWSLASNLILNQINLWAPRRDPASKIQFVWTVYWQNCTFLCCLLMDASSATVYCLFLIWGLFVFFKTADLLLLLLLSVVLFLSTTFCHGKVWCYPH